MADTHNDRATSKKKVTRKATTTRKKAATKKVVTKKKTTTKKTTAKTAAKKAAVKKKTAKKPASTSRSAPVQAAPQPSPNTPPVWDDDQGGEGLVGLLVKWGPVLLLILLIVVLDDEQTGDGQMSVGDVTPSVQTIPQNTSMPSADLSATLATEQQLVSRDATDGSAVSAVNSGATLGAIESPASFDPWGAVDQGAAGLEPGDSAYPFGDADFLSDPTWLDDPGAFFWGPSTPQDMPPAPGASQTQ